MQQKIVQKWRKMKPLTNACIKSQYVVKENKPGKAPAFKKFIDGFVWFQRAQQDSATHRRTLPDAVEHAAAKWKSPRFCLTEKHFRCVKNIYLTIVFVVVGGNSRNRVATKMIAGREQLGSALRSVHFTITCERPHFCISQSTCREISLNPCTVGSYEDGE